MSPLPEAALNPVSLHSNLVRLEPLRREHTEELSRVGLHPELWRLQPEPIDSEAAMQAYVELALAAQAAGSALPFVIIEQATGQIIGTTRYMDIALPHRRLEIGATWLTPLRQRSGANTQAKFLLLQHAFETLGMIRVVFKTEATNEASRRAILRLGGKEEGLFRKHLTARNGRLRDMVYYAILDDDWPQVKKHLQALMQARP